MLGEIKKRDPQASLSSFHPCAHRELDAFRRDEDSARIGLGEVADDVEGLEIPAELFRVQDRDRKEEPEVVTSVEGGRDRVDVQLLAELEGVALEGDVVRIDLGAEAAVALQALQGVAEALRDEVAEISASSSFETMAASSSGRR